MSPDEVPPVVAALEHQRHEFSDAMVAAQVARAATTEDRRKLAGRVARAGLGWALAIQNPDGFHGWSPRAKLWRGRLDAVQRGEEASITVLCDSEQVRREFAEMQAIAEGKPGLMADAAARMASAWRHQPGPSPLAEGDGPDPR